MTSKREIKPLRAQKPPFSGRPGRLFSGLIDIILPRHLDPKGVRQGWEHITFIDEPACYLCGVPFEYDQGKDARCIPCMTNPPTYDRGRSALLYNDHSAPHILSFKHGGRTRQLQAFAQQLKRAGRPFWQETDLIVPVPLHRDRLKARKFNQAALLAKAISPLVHVPFDPDILLRHKATPSQGTQTVKGRHRNVQGVFSVAPNAINRIKDKNIVLIDDVFTTGATLESCARTLRRAGINQIFVLSLARVVRDQEIPT